MTDAGAGWTDERVERLKTLWGEGLSASQIAAEIGGISRNAVIGKIHRLGLSGRGKAAHPRRPAADEAAAPGPTPLAARPAPALAPGPTRIAVAAAEPVPAPLEEIDLPHSVRVTIMELRESMCRWPMGDPTKPEFRFCGARSMTGIPYCAHHARIAYQPAAERKRDRKLLRA